MTNLVKAGWDASDFDQADLNAFITRQAYKFRLRNARSFWLIMPGYSPVQYGSLEGFLSLYDGDHALVFQVESTKYSDDRLTTRYEYHSKHGGLYRLNVEEVLQTSSPFTQFGRWYQTLDVVATRRLHYPEAIELASSSELLSGSEALLSIIQQRRKTFDLSSLRPTQHVSDKGVASAHTDVFSMYRSDLLVIDNDFLPADPDLLRSELRSRADTSREYAHLWYSRNPVNNLVYGHGGVKLFPREAQLLRRESNLQGDFTLSVGTGLIIHPVCLGTHAYNWSPFSTWITAAKEVAKLTLAADTQQDSEAEGRLRTWTSVFNPDSAFVAESKSGSLFGNRFPHSVLSADSPDKQRALFANHFQEVSNG